MDHEAEPAGAGSGDNGNTGVPDRTAAEPGHGEVARTTAEMPAAGTGDLRVDAALELLDLLPGLPVSEHPDLFEQVHARLSDVLGELDPGSAGTVG